MILGLPLDISTLSMIALILSPFLYLSLGICSDLGTTSSLSSLSSNNTSLLNIWYTSAVIISPTSSLYLANTTSFSRSLIFCIRFWRAVSTNLLPKSERGTSSATSSPTSKSFSIFFASDK